MTVKIGDILVGVDIGTNKTCAVIGEVTEEGLNIIGAGDTASKGIQKGIVTNIETASQGIQRAIENAEVLANCKISSVCVNITGSHIQGMNSNGVAAVHNPEIDETDIARVLESARAVPIPPDRQFLHVLPQEYIVNGQPGIRNAKGMSGVRLEAKVHIVTAVSSYVQNIIKCVDRCKVDVTDIVLSSLAASEAVLSEEEKELGCVLVDVGSGTTDIAIWSKGVLVHNHVIALGGNHLTSDIAKGFQTTLQDAEKLKIHSGCAMAAAVGSEEIIEIPASNGRDIRKLPRQSLAEIIEPRLEEIFEMVNREIENAGFDRRQFSGGVVLTGGTAIMDAVPELAERVMSLPVRRGVPRGIGGLTDFVQNPKFSTAIGLLLYGIKHQDDSLCSPQEAKNSTVLGKFLSWLKQIV